MNKSVAQLLLLSLPAALCFTLQPPASQAAHPGKLQAAAGWQDYVVVFKRRGPKFATEQTPPSHWVHLRELAESGKVAALGPLTDDGEIRGLSLIKSCSVEEARSLAEADPAVRIGRFAVEAYRWQGPAGIGAQFAAMAKKAPALPELPMTTYYVAFYKAAVRGSSPSADSEGAHQQHWEYVRRLAQAGKISAAGPFAGSGWSTLVVFQTASKEEAQVLVAEDPAVKAARLTAELHPWMVATGLLPQTWTPPVSWPNPGVCPASRG